MSCREVILPDQIAQQLQRPEGDGHRRADLVAHVGEKFALGAAGIVGQLLGPAQFRFGLAEGGNILQHPDVAGRPVAAQPRRRPEHARPALGAPIVIEPELLLPGAFAEAAGPMADQGAPVVPMRRGAPAEVQALLFAQAGDPRPGPVDVGETAVAAGLEDPQRGGFGEDAKARLARAQGVFRPPGFGHVDERHAKFAYPLVAHRGEIEAQMPLGAAGAETHFEVVGILRPQSAGQDGGAAGVEQRRQFAADQVTALHIEQAAPLEIDLADEAAGVEGEIADRGELVQLAVAVAGLLEALPGLAQLFVLRLEFHLIDAELVDERAQLRRRQRLDLRLFAEGGATGQIPQAVAVGFVVPFHPCRPPSALSPPRQRRAGSASIAPPPGRCGGR